MSPKNLLWEQVFGYESAKGVELVAGRFVLTAGCGVTECVEALSLCPWFSSRLTKACSGDVLHVAGGTISNFGELSFVLKDIRSSEPTNNMLEYPS